ncbi:MAG: hypothetical protein ACREL1_07565 [bacterium]
MKRLNFKKCILFFGILFCFATPSFSKGLVINVAIDVAGDNVIQDQVESGIEKSLSAFKDVNVIDPSKVEPDYSLDAIVIQTKNENGNITGYVASVNVIGFSSQSKIMAETGYLFRQKVLSVENVKTYVKLSLKAFDYPISCVLVDSDLSNLVDRIVSFADAQVFDKDRKAYNSKTQ